MKGHGAKAHGGNEESGVAEGLVVHVGRSKAMRIAAFRKACGWGRLSGLSAFSRIKSRRGGVSIILCCEHTVLVWAAFGRDI
jgi:hypothetical protein